MPSRGGTSASRARCPRTGSTSTSATSPRPSWPRTICCSGSSRPTTPAPLLREWAGRPTTRATAAAGATPRPRRARSWSCSTRARAACWTAPRKMIDDREWEWIDARRPATSTTCCWPTRCRSCCRPAPTISRHGTRPSAPAPGAALRRARRTAAAGAGPRALARVPGFFHRMQAAHGGRRGPARRPPGDGRTLGGDVHHAYLAEVGVRREAGARSAVYQAVCSPFRNALGRHERMVIRATKRRPVIRLLRALARSAGVPRPRHQLAPGAGPHLRQPVRHARDRGPPGHLRIEKILPGDWRRPGIENRSNMTLPDDRDQQAKGPPVTPAAVAAPGRRRSAGARCGGTVAPLRVADPAHGARRPRRPVDLPLLRRRLRAAGVRQGRAGHPDRGRSRLARSRAGACARRARRRCSSSRSPSREYQVKYRRPHGTEWEELSLDQAMDMIADRVIATRATDVGGRPTTTG